MYVPKWYSYAAIQDGKRIYTENYEYDRNGNKIYENLNDRITEYAYDGMQRLVSEVSGNRRTEYEFDGFNNISKKYELDGWRIDKTSYYYDENNRLLLKSSDNTTEQYEYDKAGNMLQKKSGIGADIVTEYYRYDGYNRLKEYIGIRDYAEYSYNINGLRESKTVNGKRTRYVYDEGNILSEITEDNNYTYYRGTELMGYTSHSGDRRYYRQDAHGNVTGLLSPDGAEEKEYSYNAYGEKETFAFNPMGDGTIIYQWKAEAEQLHNPFGYCGEYTDSETGLVYLRNRYYAPTTGRFITEDPIKDGLNWYVYCSNNPVMFVDPWGLSIKLIGSEDEMSRSFNQLQALTNDELIYDKESGIVTIARVGTMNTDKILTAGTKMVSDLIANDNFSVLIERIYLIDKGCYVYYDNGGSTIQMNDWNEESDWGYTVSDGNGGYKTDFHADVAHIVLGHELIHATHHMKGTLADSSRTVYRYTSSGLVADIRDELNMAEEYNTVGLHHIVEYATNSAGIAIRRIYMPWPGSLTENTLRAEHGLTERKAY